MHRVEIPDELYAQISFRAEEIGVSVQKFVAEAVKSRLDDEVVLTPDQLEIVERSQADISAGRFLTSAQVKASLTEYGAEWQEKRSA